MARVPAGLPAGVRVTDHIRLGVIARAFPPDRVRQVLAETGKASERERCRGPTLVMPGCKSQLGGSGCERGTVGSAAGCMESKPRDTGGEFSVGRLFTSSRGWRAYCHDRSYLLPVIWMTGGGGAGEFATGVPRDRIATPRRNPDLAVGRTHMVAQHRSALPGVEAMTLLTDHVFPRHSHDGFGIGIMITGAQRRGAGSDRWSPRPAT